MSEPRRLIPRPVAYFKWVRRVPECLDSYCSTSWIEVVKIERTIANYCMAMVVNPIDACVVALDRVLYGYDTSKRGRHKLLTLHFLKLFLDQVCMLFYYRIVPSNASDLCFASRISKFAIHDNPLRCGGYLPWL